MADATKVTDQGLGEPGGFAMIPVPLLKIWHLLPPHHAKILPLLLSWGPGDMFVGQKKIAALAHCSRKTVNETLGQLVASGLLLAEQTWRDKDNGRSTVNYRLADLDDDITRLRIGAWYSEHTRRTPVTRWRRPDPMSPPAGYMGCNPQRVTRGVTPKQVTGDVTPSGLQQTRPEDHTPLPDEKNGEAASPPGGLSAAPPWPMAPEDCQPTDYPLHPQALPEIPVPKAMERWWKLVTEYRQERGLPVGDPDWWLLAKSVVGPNGKCEANRYTQFDDIKSMFDMLKFVWGEPAASLELDETIPGNPAIWAGLKYVDGMPERQKTHLEWAFADAVVEGRVKTNAHDTKIFREDAARGR